MFADATGTNEYARTKNARTQEQHPTEWMDGNAHCGLSADGVPIIYCIPSFLNKPTHVSTI